MTLSLHMLMTLGVALAGFVAMILIRVSIRQQIIETHLSRIDKMLTAWAQGWGDPPEKMRAQLLAILMEDPSSREAGSPMGADLGVSVVCAVLARAFFR